MKKIKIPLVPLSALIFYLLVLLFWKFGAIPSPAEIFDKLEILYEQNGSLGLFVSTILEGLVYVGLYFPGSSIIALSVILSDGSFLSLLGISIVVASSLTLTSLTNYLLGRRFAKKSKGKVNRAEKHMNTRGLLLSSLHPNALAFYFFKLGVDGKSFKEIIYVPAIMIPYGFVLALVLYLLRSPIQGAIEAPGKIVIILVVWVLISTFLNYKRQNTK